MKGILEITVGISNSGKSTYAREMVERRSGIIEVNRDDIRIDVFLNGERSKYHTYKFTRSNESYVTAIAHERVYQGLEAGKHVICSDTNLNPKYREALKEIAVRCGAHYTETFFDVPLETCIKRNRQRDITIPVSVIERQYKDFRIFMGRPFVEHRQGLPKAVIFDIDGTLAIKAKERDIHDLTKVSLDLPNPNVINLVKMYRWMGYKILVTSGRDDSCMEDTAKWLADHAGHIDGLFMRKKGDVRMDAIVKEEIFWESIYPKYNVQLCIDDRDQVVRQWRSMGLECHQVAAGEF